MLEPSAWIQACAALDRAQDPGGARKIAHDTALDYGLTFEEMISLRRDRHIVRARHHAMWKMKKNTDRSLPQIGRILGDRDHTTVLHGVRAHEKRCCT
jgi:chromosomal replication initiation ATPase DnaA